MLPAFFMDMQIFALINLKNTEKFIQIPVGINL